MSDPPGPGGPFGFPPGFDPESLRDAPLFRELQRVMAASSGPVNWELARQVGVAGVAEEGPDPEPTDDDHRALEQAVRVAELQVADLTGLEVPGELAHVRGIRRAAWVSSSAESLRPLLEPAAASMSEAMTAAMREQLPEEAAGFGPLLGQIGPLLQGTQIGTVLASLARQVLGRYDVAVPRSDTSELSFVVANIAAFEHDWSLDPAEFRTYVALHEVAHRASLARPWTQAYLRELLADYHATLTLDIEGLQQRLATLDPSDPEALQRAMQGEEALLGPVLDDEQRLKLRRIQAFMAATEGYADHVAAAVGRRLLGSFARIAEAMRRYREGEAADPVFERLLGVEIPRARREAGTTFCDTVAQRSDEPTLARMWESSETMPSSPEIDEPTLWLSRTV